MASNKFGSMNKQDIKNKQKTYTKDAPDWQSKTALPPAAGNSDRRTLERAFSEAANRARKQPNRLNKRR
jgi:hypothetical protein